MAKIIFNNKEYSINDSALSDAIDSLKAHLSSTMNGTGVTIALGGVSYSIDSTKLSNATTAFTTHLGTISGSGSKIVVGGVEYSIDSNKVSDAVSDLEVVLGNLNVGGNSGWQGTPIPNSGYVEKVYFNTSKDFQSYYNLFEKLDYIEYGGSLVYPILFNPEVYMLYIKVHNYTDNDNVIDYGIYYQNLTDGSHHPSAPIIVHEGGYLEKWSSDFIERGSYVEVNNNVIDNLQGINIGLQNDILKDFVSLTPFENKEEQSTPTAVPNSGYVENVYFNTSLSVEEMVDIMNDVAIEVGESLGYYVLSDANMLYTLSFAFNNNLGKEQWIIYATVNSQEPTLIWSEESGWASENNVIEYNIDNVIEMVLSQMGMNQPMQNDKLINLISITPFN